MFWDLSVDCLMTMKNQLREYAESGGELESPTWAQHHLMEIKIGNENYLVDSTNGNFPFMFPWIQMTTENILRPASKHEWSTIMRKFKLAGQLKLRVIYY